MAYCIENGVINVECQCQWRNINMAYHISASLPAISSGSQRWLAAANGCSYQRALASSIAHNLAAAAAKAGGNQYQSASSWRWRNGGNNGVSIMSISM
jgi:hypothetical protein